VGGQTRVDRMNRIHRIEWSILAILNILSNSFVR